MEDKESPQPRKNATGTEYEKLGFSFICAKAKEYIDKVSLCKKYLISSYIWFQRQTDEANSGGLESSERRRQMPRGRLSESPLFATSGALPAPKLFA